MNWPQFEDPENCALSFYFQPTAPRNKAHKEEAILTKDLAREAVRQLESSEVKMKRKLELARADLDRIVELAQELRSNGVHAKAVFACSGTRISGASMISRAAERTQLWSTGIFT